MKNLSEFIKTFGKLTEKVKEQSELMLKGAEKIEENSRLAHEEIKIILNK